MHTKKLIAAMMAAGALLAGCGGSDDAKPKAVEAKNEAGKTVSGLQRRDSANRTYQDIVLDFNERFYYGDKVHLAYRDLYWAAADRDDDKLAADFIPEYRKETDAFKRQDMLKELKPKLDEIYAQQHGAKNVSIRLRATTSIYGYDAAEKGFRIDAVTDNNSISVNKTEGDREQYYVFILPIVMVDGYKSFMLKPSEEDARRIESYLSSKRRSANDPVEVAVQLHGYVADTQTTDNNDRYAIIATDAISFLDMKTGEKIVDLASKDLAPVIDLSTTTMYLPSEKAFREKFGLAPARSTMGIP
jgi:hypothetical protein